MLKMVKEIIKVDKTHRILVDRERGKDSIKPFVVFIPQRKGLLFWNNYHFIDFCQDFKYDYERDADYDEYDAILQELIDYFPELDKIKIENGGVL